MTIKDVSNYIYDCEESLKNVDKTLDIIEKELDNTPDVDDPKAPRNRYGIGQTLYLLTCDGIPRDDPYGSWIYCIGVYPTEEEAMLNANELPKDLDWEITPIILGETYPLHGGPYSYKNDKKLGGYIE